MKDKNNSKNKNQSQSKNTVGRRYSNVMNRINVNDKNNLQEKYLGLNGHKTKKV